jgi:hypothetical protein
MPNIGQKATTIAQGILLKIALPSLEKPQKHTVSALSPLEAGAEVTPGELIAWS